MAPKAAEGPERSWAGLLFPSRSQEGILSSSAIKAVSVPDQVPDPLLYLKTVVCHQLDSLLRKKGDRPSNSYTAPPPDAGRRGRPAPAPFQATRNGPSAWRRWPSPGRREQPPLAAARSHKGPSCRQRGHPRERPASFPRGNRPSLLAGQAEPKHGVRVSDVAGPALCQPVTVPARSPCDRISHPKKGRWTAAHRAQEGGKGLGPSYRHPGGVKPGGYLPQSLPLLPVRAGSRS